MPKKKDTHTVIRKKVLLLGDSGTGKTHLLRAHKSCKTLVRHLPTVLQTTVVPVKIAEDGRKVELALWEVGGASSTKDLLTVAASGADAAAICYAVDDPTSLQNGVKVWAEEMHSINPLLPLFIIGCKADLKPEKPGKYRKKRHRELRSKDIGPGRGERRHGNVSQNSEGTAESNDDVSRKFVYSRRGANAASIIDAEFKECSAKNPSSVRSVFRRIANMVL